MVKPETVAGWVKLMGGVCKKIRGKDVYDCRFEGVRIQVTPNEVKVGPTTETDYGSYKTYATKWTDEMYWMDAEKVLTEDTDFSVDIETERWIEEQFWFIFDIDNYREALDFAKKLAKEDIWIKIKYHGEIFFKKGDETFNDVYEFKDYLDKLVGEGGDQKCSPS